MSTVTLRDETATGRELDSVQLPDLPSSITLRELIRLRVREEVARFNAAEGDMFRGLVQPTDTEATLNGFRVRGRRRLDWERQADTAERAFARNGFFVLVDDRQVEDIDAVVDLTGDPVVSFVKLVPLVGG